MAEEQKEQKQKHTRPMPQNELDYHMMLTNSAWGKAEISPSLQEKLSQQVIKRTVVGVDENNKPIIREEVTTENSWHNLSFISRDLKLANLSNKFGNDEVAYCEYRVTLAADCLQANMPKAFLACMNQVAPKLDLSQSKGGFLRKNFKTDTLENINVDKEPPKKSLFGLGKKQE